MVAHIAPRAKNGLDIVTYEVHLTLQAGDLALRAGMTANADLVTAYRQGVLLDRTRAIIADRQADKYYVDLKRGDQVKQAEVQVGLRDGTYTEILDGLSEGDRLVIRQRKGLSFDGPPSAVQESF